ncbi:hypothetical protein UM538_14275 [Staphylococcus aureus]|nr:hypothetical protein UM538_14275 [Staphylococcus aureus]
MTIHMTLTMINQLPLLVKTAISQVEAGADIIAPSNMMDGFVAEIRRGLDEAGYYNIPIMSYGVSMHQVSLDLLRCSRFSAIIWG